MYEWEQGKDGKWRLYEYDKSRQVMQYYHQGTGKRRLFRDHERLTVVFNTREEGRAYVHPQPWGASLPGA